MILRRLIKGVPYTFRKNVRGWAVTCVQRKVDRFFRCYQVTCDEKSRPLKCSCPVCFYNGLWCKHLHEVESMYYEDHPEEVVALAKAAIRHGLAEEGGQL